MEKSHFVLAAFHCPEEHFDESIDDLIDNLNEEKAFNSEYPQYRPNHFSSSGGPFDSVLIRIGGISIPNEQLDHRTYILETLFGYLYGNEDFRNPADPEILAAFDSLVKRILPDFNVPTPTKENSRGTNTSSNNSN